MGESGFKGYKSFNERSLTFLPSQKPGARDGFKAMLYIKFAEDAKLGRIVNITEAGVIL